MTLDALDLLVPVKAIGTAVISPTDAPAVHDSETGFSLLPHPEAYLSAQVIEQQIGLSQRRPFAIIIADRFPWGEISGKHTPLAARFNYIKNDVPYLSQIYSKMFCYFFARYFIKY
jgi:hypothetical protein